MKQLLTILTLVTVLASCERKQTLFKEIKSAHSNIHFSNEIKEDDNLNVVNYEYLYNGGGVGIGDFNNDSLPDIYFTGNRVPNKLYLNKGNMQFEDVTALSGVGGGGKWCKGVSVIDINNDGMLDIYVNVAVTNPARSRINLLYVCKRIDPVLHIPIYVEMAAEYGLADSSHTQMASFFDFDNDGDLDVYLLINELNENYPNDFRPIKSDGSMPNTDKLLRNDWNETLQHSVFTDVSKQAGITWEGYGLGVSTCDINGDGWKDIYVSNDYLSNNELYINNRNGTFTNRCAEYFKHTSRNAMGNDIADINNDGLPDLIELDMAPADNYRLKMMNNPINYSTFQNSTKFGYMQQYVRNVLQVNQGPRMLGNDSIGEPVFSELGYFSGVAHTDWSWAPLLIDADNDGWRDLLVSNGLPKDMTDLDFMAYRHEAKTKTPIADVLNQLPSVKISNYIFKNNHDLTFSDKTVEWGWHTPTFSTGMGYADFDRDGDLDVVVNNTNMAATLLENKGAQNNRDSSNYLQIQLMGDSSNRNGIGAVIELHHKGQLQLYENNPYRGYLSSVENIAHFGLGKATTIDSVIVYWPGKRMQLLTNVSSNQRLILDVKNYTALYDHTNNTKASGNLLTDVTIETGINYNATETDFIDFSIQRLMPHKLSQYGPSLAAGDLNGDGLDDLVIGGSAPNAATLYVQQATGKFVQQPFAISGKRKLADDEGICLFDADGDGDMDIFIAAGGFENSPGSVAYEDHFYRNDGKGKFTIDSAAIPKNFTSKSCVKAADYDNDGDLDLLIGGRVLPGSYPMPVSSFIYRNNGKGNFTDVTSMVAPALTDIGLLCDAVWSDTDSDGDMDLLLAGEWMPLTIFKNENGKFTSVPLPKLSSLTGWFNSITAADLDNDGDTDYVLGNYGNNGFYQPAQQYPVSVYGKDFDKNESFDAVYSTWLPSGMNATKKEYPAAGRDELIKEMTYMKGRFANYTGYAKTAMKDLFTVDELKGSIQLSSNFAKTGWVENLGNFQYAWHDLPQEIQWSPVFGIAVNDLNNDGNLDIIFSGNDHGMAPTPGRNDAMNGLVLQGDGKGNFNPLSIVQSGFFVPGDGKALIQFVSNNTVRLAASQNQGPLKIFQSRKQAETFIRIMPDDVSAMVTLKNGQKRKEEFYYGSSFLSQSSRFIAVSDAIAAVEIINNKKVNRTLKF